MRDRVVTATEKIQQHVLEAGSAETPFKLLDDHLFLIAACTEDETSEDRHLGEGYKTGATTLDAMVQSEFRLGRMRE